MMEGIQSLCMLSFFCGFAMHLAPKGAVREVMQLLSMAALVIVSLSFFRGVDHESFAWTRAEIREQEQVILSEGEDLQKRLNRMVIEDECETYIWDKAEKEGCALQAVEVEAKWNKDGMWLPWSVRILTEDIRDWDRLEIWLQTELGIPLSRQQWSVYEGTEG